MPSLNDIGRDHVLGLFRRQLVLCHSFQAAPCVRGKQRQYFVNRLLIGAILDR